MAKSGLFGMKTADQALALMLVAQAEGQHPATIAQDYDIIQGRAARKTHSVLARFQQAGGKVEWHELTDKKADAMFSHPSGGDLRMTWTFDQAQKIGLTGKDNWKNYPRAMLRARCIAEGVRAVYPAALGGMMVAEEAQDMGPSELDGAQVGKPAVTMPQAKANPKAAELVEDVTDVTPKGETAAAPNADLATVGEVAYILKKINNKGTTIAEARELAGLDVGDKLDGLTKDGFIALKDALV
jgi:hypothetical protein